MSIKLISANIKNFKSLADVELNFRDLTILVGPNSSGKSNSLEALNFLNTLLIAPSPPLDLMHKILRLGTKDIYYEISVEDDENNKADYKISVRENEKNAFITREYLKVNGIEVIDILNGEGQVKDENGENNQKYQSSSESIDGLALRTAGNFGNKPFTRKLANYIKNWNFYDIVPDSVTTYPDVIEKTTKSISRSHQSHDITPTFDVNASKAHKILQYWAKNERNKFDEISQELQDCLQISLNSVEDREGEPIVKVVEEDGKEIVLSNISNGTLRLIAYFILLYQSDIPTLIGLEEPEINFHPRILKYIASLIKRLSNRTQVIFTTHSSQLLDCFAPEEISSEISVIILNKKGSSGTKSCLLDHLAENRQDILDWMNDFGLGSAIYHSHLIEEVLAV